MARLRLFFRLAWLGLASMGPAWVALSAESGPPTPYAYVAYRFTPEEHWSLSAQGNAGRSQLSGNFWSFDFTRGASWLSLTLPDRSLLGKVGTIRLRVRGKAKGHPVHVFLRTHFMTFHKVVGEFSQEGEQELAFDAPPGPGWQWFGGENDGKLHGPLRLAEVRLEANGLADFGVLELVSIGVEGTCPSDRLCVIVPRTEAAGRRVTFSVEVRSLSDSALQGELQWVFRNWDKREIGRGQKALVAPPRGLPLLVSAPAPPLPRRWRFLEAEFKLAVEGQDVPPAAAQWVAALESPGDSDLRPESPFGMGLYLCRFRGPDLDKVARAARQAGVKWSREDFSWPAIEPERGKFDWDFHDKLLASARGHGITVYAIVAGWPHWTKPYTKQGIEDYAAFLQALVKRYRAQIKHWEIWNEPNIFFWQGPKELYADLLTRSYAAIKEVDPTAQVLGLSTAGIDFKYIEDMLARKAPFDVLTIHPYRKTLDDAAFIQDLKRVHELVRLPDGRPRPVWLTEIGWATHLPHNALGQDFQPNSQRAQAELIARTYLCSIVSGVEPRTFWYDFRNDGEDPFYFEHSMGIVQRDFTPKPAYRAFATLARLLADKKLQGSIKADSDTFAFRFVSRGPGAGNVRVFWNPHRDTRLTIPWEGKRLTLINTMGEARQLKPPRLLVLNLARRVHVDLKKGAPLYVLEGEPFTQP
jgi:hypothetical protein